MERHLDLDPCDELDTVAVSIVDSVRHIIEDHVASSACICGLPADDGRRACDDLLNLLLNLLYDLQRDYPPADPAWLTDFVARWPVVWAWGTDDSAADLTDFVRSAIRYDLELRVGNVVVDILDAKARQIGLPDTPPPAPPTRPQLLVTLAALDDGELRAVLAAIADAQTTGNGWLVHHGRLIARPALNALIVEPASVEGHIVKLAYTYADDGIHLSCSCGWDHNLGFNADVPGAAANLSRHLATAAPSAPL